MDISGLKNARHITELENIVRRTVTPENYFSSEINGWTLTQAMKQGERERAVILCALNGTDTTGTHLDSAQCEGMKFRLKVLTRQACWCDKDGNLINGFSALESNRNGIDYITPKPEEQPVKGDMVRLIGNIVKKDPDTGRRVENRQQRQEIVDRHGIGADYEHQDFAVDEDGCISVNYRAAIALLSQKGREIVVPQFRKMITGGSPEDMKKQRKITNWHFKEVPPKRENAGANNRGK